MIDLHAHTTASDGRSTPTELMFQARDAGVTVLGLTDHDTVAGWDEAAGHVAATGVSLVRGMEVSARIDGISVHLLAYLFDPRDPALVRHGQTMLQARLGRARQMVERIGRDYPLTWEAVQALSGPEVPVGRPHIADALIGLGVVGSRDEAFARFLTPACPYYVGHYAPRAADVVEWVNAAGGKVVFAHPTAAARGHTASLAQIEELADAGLFGLEIDHRDNADVDQLVKLARRRGLVRTGSSDYHGSGKANRLGENVTSPRAYEALISGCFLEVLVP
ncbi:MAG: PHP domain-containing protein [Actinomycetaceae bacterium]|nr:PHP domain-containing protein [Actinomycetaceae bacterium]